MSNELDLAAIDEAIEDVRSGEQRLAGAQNKLRASVAGWFALRLGIELVDEIREAEEVAFVVVLRDVEVARLHQSADDRVQFEIELLQVFRLARHLGDAEQRGLQHFDASRFRDIAEMPRAAGVLAV